MPPTEVQQKILSDVVDRFLKTGESTPRKDLVRKFKNLNALNELPARGVLKSYIDGDYLPLALAFHYCGNADAKNLAKYSVQLLDRVFQTQYLDNTQKFTREGIEEDG